MERDRLMEVDGQESYVAFSNSTPAPTVDSSSLSDAPSEQQNDSAGPLATPAEDQGFFGDHAQEQKQADTAIVPDSTNAIAAKDESGDGEADLPFKCQHCDKAYSTEKSLRRHVNDKKSTCAKIRSGAADEVTKWACPRCHAHLGKKYSALRHVQDSCWKLCDECCEAGNAQCDAFHKDGICTNCEMEGRSCTKHTEAVPGCVPERLTDLPSEPKQPAPKTKRTAAATRPKIKREKRQAAMSPDTSPQSKHVAKRPETVSKKDRTTLSRSEGKNARGNSSGRLQLPRVQDQLPLRDFPQSSDPNVVLQYAQHPHRPPVQPSGAAPGPPRNQLMRQARTVQDASKPKYPLPPEVIEARIASIGPIERTWGPNKGSRPGPPRLYQTSNQNSYGPGQSNRSTPDFQNDRRLMEQSLLHQEQLMRNMGMRAQYNQGPVIGHYPPPPVRNSATGLNFGRQAFEDIHPADTRVGRFRQAQNADFQIHEDGLSRARAAGFLASAPGSRLPSRQSSVEQNGAHRSRVASRQPSFRPLQELNSVSDAQNASLKTAVPRELTQSIALQRSPSPTPDPAEPTLKLRIHSNIYDSNGTAIFSILLIRPSQKFGPRLDAYCQHRKKHYGVDWVCIYRYRAATEQDKNRHKYIKITYNMTPNDVKDDDYPGMAIADMDTIFVMKAKPRNAAMVENSHAENDAAPSPAGSQISCEEIKIVNGETPIYQDGKTITQWYTACETKMHSLRNSVGDLQSTIARQDQTMAKQQEFITRLSAQNAILQRLNMQFNHDQRILSFPSQQDLGQTLPMPDFTTAQNMLAQPLVQHGLQPPSFMNRLESVREPRDPTMAMPRAPQPQQLPTLLFPTGRDFSSYGGQYQQPNGYTGFAPAQGNMSRAQDIRIAAQNSLSRRQNPTGRDAGVKVEAAKKGSEVDGKE